MKTINDLLPLDQAYKILSETEPLKTSLISSDTKVSFELEGGLPADLKTVSGTTPVGAFVTIDGTEYQMSRDAILQAAALFGIPAAYVKRAPSHLINTDLNYWYSLGLDDQMFSALRVGDTVQAITGSKHIPFSNVQLLDRVVDSIASYVGDSDDLYVDPRIQHSLVKTDIRLIAPESSYPIHLDSNTDHVWSPGIHMSNSIVGKGMTSIDSYLFNWDNGNGATLDAKAGQWNRRLNGQEELDLLDWVDQTVHELMGAEDDRLTEVQALTKLDVTGSLQDTTREIFDSYKIPQRSRGAIIDALAKTPTAEVTMYSVMQAVAKAAQDAELPDAKADFLMRVAGSIPTARFDPMKAKIFAAGQTNPTGPNPYIIPTAVTD